MDVTVAVVGDPSRPFGQGLRLPEDMEIPYEQRRAVDLEVAGSETLGQVLTRACEEIGLELPWEGPVISGIGFIDFYRRDRWPMLSHHVTILDADGHVEWISRWKDVPYERLVRAGESHVLVGDPRRPYLLLQPEVGNGVLITLGALYGAWKLLWEVVDNAAKFRKLADAAENLLRGRARDAGGVIESHYEEWQRNGASPGNLTMFLGDHAWSLDHLAEVLGCTTDQAEALLLGFGHERGDDGLWHPGESEEAKFLRDSIQLLMHAGAWVDDDLRDALRERAEQLFDHGEAPPLDWSALPDARVDDAKLEEMNEDFRKTMREREAREGPTGSG
jgi:hypothetical protein